MLMRALRLTMLTQLATYKQRFWEPLLIVVAIFIASAGLSAVTLINTGASQQLNQLQLGSLTASWQVTATNTDVPLLQRDYAGLRQQGFSSLVAYTQVSDSQVAIDTLALLEHLPAQSGFTPMNAALTGSVIDINAYYQGDVRLESHPLTGLAVIGELTAEPEQHLRAALPPHLQLIPLTLPASSAQQSNNLAASFSLNLWAMGTLMVLVSAFIVVNALNLLLTARTPVLAKLRQLGVGQSVLLSGLFAEMLVLTLIGMLCGVMTGAALISQLSPTLSSIYRLLLDSQFSAAHWSFSTLLLKGLALALLAVVLTIALSYGRVRGLLQYRAQQTAMFNQQPLFIQWLGLGLAIGFVIVGLQVINSQLTALLYIGLVLAVGCATVLILMPVMLRFIARGISAQRAVLHWSAHNAVALSRRTRLAACAFFIALAANIGMNVMVDSFRTATEHWLSQRLFAPFYIYTGFEGDLSAIPGAPVELLPRYGRDIRLYGQSTEVRSFPDHPGFQQYLLLDVKTQDAWSDFYQGQGVFINQQLANRQQLQPGDDLALFINSDSTATIMHVIGIFPDYGNPKAQVLVAEHVLKNHYNTITAYAAFADQANLSALANWLNHIDSRAQLVPREQMIAQSMRIFSRTFTTTDTLNMVTMLVAALSFFVSISLLVLDITPQLRLLRSAGVSTFRIKLSLFAQYSVIALSCALLALPFALLLAWLLVNKVNRFAFHWTYPLVLDPLIVLQSALLGLGILLVLLALPVGRLQAKFYTQQGGL